MLMKYTSPKINEITVLELEREILAASVIVDENWSVETVGQEVEEIPLDGFNSKWE